MVLVPSLETLQPELLSRKTRKPVLYLQNLRYRKSTYLLTPQLCYCHCLERDSVPPGAGVRVQGLFRFPVGRGSKCGAALCFIHPLPPADSTQGSGASWQTDADNVCAHVQTCPHTNTGLSLLSPSPPPTPRVTEQRHWPPDCQRTRKR